MTQANQVRANELDAALRLLEQEANSDSDNQWMAVAIKAARLKLNKKVSN